MSILNFLSHTAAETTSFLNLRATRIILCEFSVLKSFISSNSLFRKSPMTLLASSVELLPLRYESSNSAVCSSVSVETYDAYLMACHTASRPESSVLFSITTSFPSLSSARTSSLSFVLSQPENSFRIIRSPSPRILGLLTIHSFFAIHFFQRYLVYFYKFFCFEINFIHRLFSLKFLSF